MTAGMKNGLIRRGPRWIMSSVCCSIVPMPPMPDPILRSYRPADAAEITHRAPGLAVSHEEEQSSHEDHGTPEYEGRPGVGVGAQDLDAEALTDVPAQVERRVAQGHEAAPQAKQDGHAQVDRPTPGK